MHLHTHCARRNFRKCNLPPDFIVVPYDTAGNCHPHRAVPVLDFELGDSVSAVFTRVEGFCKCWWGLVVLEVITEREDVYLIHEIEGGKIYLDDVAGVFALRVVVPAAAAAPVLTFAIAVNHGSDRKVAAECGDEADADPPPDASATFVVEGACIG